MRQVKELMKHDSLNSHYKELVMIRFEASEARADIDHILQQCWQESCELFHMKHVARDCDPACSLPSQHDSVSLVKQLWSTGATIRQQQPLAHAELRSVLRGWQLAARLQNNRQLRKASKRRKVEVVQHVVQSTKVFKAAKILYPKTPRRRLQLMDSEGNIQTRESRI